MSHIKPLAFLFLLAPLSGRRFRCSRQPYTALWFDQVDSGRWSRCVAIAWLFDGPGTITLTSTPRSFTAQTSSAVMLRSGRKYGEWMWIVWRAEAMSVWISTNSSCNFSIRVSWSLSFVSNRVA